MTERAFGVIVPSSNRVVERTTEKVLAYFPDLAACYSRIPLFGAGGGQPSDGYNVASLDSAIELLSHAQIELICWNGTKGAGLGFTPDRDFCDAIKARTGLPMVSTALATLEVLKRLGVKRFGMVSPLPQENVEAMAGNFVAQGFEPVGAKGMGHTDNFAFSEVTPEEIATAARALFEESRPEAILLFNTNLRGLSSSAPLEAELGIPVIDSAATGVWAVLDAMGIDRTPAAPLGRLFGEA
ncbi:Asp/Glu/hydantoin racemase [Arsenicitalea aurantiaca]|uniref:Asp/Glu/hydantoin racemase n=1 Tax=Arsenicitalea aurantiaca TaxID=1783274 RepID=A0A433XBK9_9HYPH|nr:aspartate/glutamate racemase family protein [Arsenicitalea aurantiaca]RUT31410.1 Asp/Glu/hydantoin racemase [Arsenicitalea aurantiaca]